MYAQVHYNCERETCSLCSKFIYKHQTVVNLDSDDNFNTFDDSMCDTLNCANTILQSCCYNERVQQS